MSFYLLRYHHPTENTSRFAFLEIGKFTLLEIIIDWSKTGFSLVIEA